MPWRRTEAGLWQWDEPRWTLGWQVMDWAEAHFRVPGGPFAGQPLRLSGWQAMFLADWYAVDELGRFVASRGVVRLAKKSGKSPVGGVVAAAALCGPSQFDGWDAYGEPVGRPHPAPWVQVMAVSEDQTANTFAPARAMLRDSSLVDEVGLDIGASAIVLAGRRECLLEAVTASAVSREGQPTTDVIGDEGQSWTPSNSGKRLYRVARRNTSPMGGRVLLFANAYEPGAQSVSEDVELAADTESATLVLGPQYEVADVDLADGEAVRAALRTVYRDAPWVDVESVARDVMTADQDPYEVARFYFNHPVASGYALGEPQMVVDDLAPGSPVALGFQGSHSREEVSLVAVHMATGAAYLLRSYVRPVDRPKRDPWEAPHAALCDDVAEAFSRFDVAAFVANPSGWRDEFAGWKRAWPGRVHRFDMQSQSAVDAAVDAAQAAIREGSLRVSAAPEDSLLASQVRFCVVPRRQSGSKLIRSLSPSADGGSIESARALVLAWHARLHAVANGWSPSERKVPALW